MHLRTDCKPDKGGGNKLIQPARISGYSLGHESGVQAGLDFEERDNELCASAEMGDGALRAHKLCVESPEKILARLQQEIPTLSSALKWSRKVSG